MQIKSMMLEHVISCEYDRKSFPVFLLLGGVLLISGAYMAFGANNAEVGLLAEVAAKVAELVTLVPAP